ncbi:MAG: AAA family ATPase [Clostridia bacterium]|nr:AAA family ATPase [Clostridia bacterium]
MEIRIYNLKLKNFKGIKDLEIVFDGKNTNIYGKNATGKTTVFDAFKWLFFDKDSNDRKDFNVKTLDANNKPIHYLEHEVEATLIIDGQDVNFRKMLQEKWVKKRGQEQQEFSGHETSYWIDEVPVKKKDYEEKINTIIPENLFKLITDPSFFNNQMSWKERRELLINISGTTITDDMILTSDEQFTSLKENLEGRSIDDYSKVLASKIKELNRQKETIPVRIDELTKTLITEHNINYEELENEKKKYNEELQKIELEMTDIQSRVQENMKKADQLAKAKNELNNLKFKLEIEHNQKYSQKSINLQNEKSMLENNLRRKKHEYEDLELQIENDTKRKDELYKKWDEIINLKLEFDPNSFICPTCKREYETDKIDEMKKEFANNLHIHKESEKQAINKEGQTLKARIEENTSTKEKIQSEINEFDIKLQEVNKQLADIERQQSNSEDFDVTILPQYQEKIKEVENLEQIVNKIVASDTTEIQHKKSNIMEQINNIDRQLNERDVQEKTKMRISELEKEEEEISQKVQELESQQFQIEQFIKTKVELLENAINSNFEIVKFRLFKTQINGGLEECCDTLVNGVPYSDVNNAHKIIAGLDIIKTLSKFHNRTAPIFIDNRESINTLCVIDAQIISLVVTEDPKLRIEVG